MQDEQIYAGWTRPRLEPADWLGTLTSYGWTHGRLCGVDGPRGGGAPDRWASASTRHLLVEVLRQRLNLDRANTSIALERHSVARCESLPA